MWSVKAERTSTRLARGRGWARFPLNVFVLLLFIVLGSCSKQSESVVSIALHPTKSHIMYVATNEAVSKSRDGGLSWEKFENFSARRVTTIVIDPKFPATIYAGTMGDAVYKSPDGGQRWLPHNVGLKEHVSYVNQFVFDPHNSQIIYAATTVGAYRTRDGGRSWEERMAGMKEVHIVVTLALAPTSPNIMYAGTTGGVYKSTDGTSTWKKVNTGLIPSEILDASLSLGVNILMVNPVDPLTTYAGTTKGLFRTTDGGQSWQRIGEGLPDQFISTLVIDPTQPATLYIGGRAGIFKSLDSGGTWKAMNNGLETLNIRTVVLSPLDPTTLFAGTNGSGLYRSQDGGATWVRVPLDRNSLSPNIARL